MEFVSLFLSFNVPMDNALSTLMADPLGIGSIAQHTYDITQHTRDIAQHTLDVAQHTWDIA